MSKVTIRARPIFEFAVTMDDIKKLKELSKNHYDGKCQRASMAISDYNKMLRPGQALGADIVNGILVIWEMYFDYAAKEDMGKPIFVTCTSDDVDLLSKITETWVAHNAPNRELGEFAMKFHSMLSQAWHMAESQVPLWTKEIETV